MLEAKKCVWDLALVATRPGRPDRCALRSPQNRSGATEAAQRRQGQDAFRGRSKGMMSRG